MHICNSGLFDVSHDISRAVFGLEEGLNPIIMAIGKGGTVDGRRTFSLDGTNSNSRVAGNSCNAHDSGLVDLALTCEHRGDKLQTVQKRSTRQ